MFDLLKKKWDAFAKQIGQTQVAETQATNESKKTKTPEPRLDERPTTHPNDPEPRALQPKTIQKTPDTSETAKDPPTPTIESQTPNPLFEPARKIAPKTGILEGLQSRLTGSVRLRADQVEPALTDLEWALAEADVDLDTAEKIKSNLRKKLVDHPLDARNGVEHAVHEQIRQTLIEMTNVPPIDVPTRIREKKDKPFVILLLGPNGAGKTTSMAKLTAYLKQQNLSVVWSASDTFRAASIEQLEVHGQRLGVRVIKHAYGSDPAAVAFDAIASGKKTGADAVLLDSAGRQETNANLMNELGKLKRVAKPDLTLYVGESYAGQALLDQAREFDQKLGLDGLILTKLDADPKGGTLLSLVAELHKPVLFIGTGQEYDDWEPFDSKKLVDRILG